MTYKNPFDGLPLEEIYDGFLSGRFGPKWPDEDLQKGYTGTNKIALLRRAFDFLSILEKDGAFEKSNFKGLDYGCGWGRFASVMLSRADASQFDLCDAWQVTLNHISKLNYENKIFKIPSLLEKGSIKEKTYNFILSFSVFTHISPLSFEKNIPVLLDSLKKDGVLYITVRHEEFIDHKYSSRKAELVKELETNGFVYVDSGGDMNSEKLFGDMVITQKYLEQFGKVRYLGLPHTLQHVYAISKA